MKAKNTSLFDSAAAAPPKERTAQSRHKNRRISKKNSLPAPSAPYVASTFSKGIVTTEMGKGILMYERPEDQHVVECLNWNGNLQATQKQYYIPLKNSSTHAGLKVHVQIDINQD